MFNKSLFYNRNKIVLTAGQEDLHSDQLSKTSDKYGVLVTVNFVGSNHVRRVFNYGIYQAHNELDPALTRGAYAVPPDYAKIATTRLIASGSATYRNNYIMLNKPIDFKISNLTGKEIEKVLKDAQKGWHLINTDIPNVINNVFQKQSN